MMSRSTGVGAVGVDLPRPEGPDKVEGRALYVADIEVEGAWTGLVLRSHIAHGSLEGLDVDPSFPTDEAVLVRPADIPGINRVAMIAPDQPVLADEIIRHVGEPLALVAAQDVATAARALAALTARIAPLPPVLDFETSDDVFKEITIEKGDDPESLFEGAAHVFEGVYRTDSQEQMYIEPQGVIAWPADEHGVVRVQGSLQCPYYVQKAVAQCLGIEPAKARIVQAATGGGFGGKEDYPSVLACQAALLARASGRPVRLILDRHEDLCVTPKRHPACVRHRTAVAADGRLLAMEIDVRLDAGAYVTLSPVVLSRASIHAAGPYRCDSIRIRGRALRTNHVPYGAFRGFGAPQVCFAIERQMDRVARALGIHPARLREINMLRRGDLTATGQKLQVSVGSEEVFARALERTQFDKHEWAAPERLEQSGQLAAVDGGRRVRRGVGFAFFYHGSGFTGAGEELMKSRVAVELTGDGGVRVCSASTEFGQGTLTLFQAIAAETLGVSVALIEIAPADTGIVPDSGPTVASRTCMVVGGSLVRACRQLLERLGERDAGDPDDAFRAQAAAFLESGGDGRVEVVYSSPPGLEWDDETYRGDAYPAYGWAVDVAEIEIDMDTFDVRVTRFVSAVDVGKAIQPAMVRGQIEGGSLQAIGFAHLEVVTTKDGRFLQDRMASCIIPTTLDAPPMEVDLIEDPFPQGPYGAKGVGELPMDGGAPAVVSAIEDALGVHVEHVPATPERIAAAWLAAHPEDAL